MKKAINPVKPANRMLLWKEIRLHTNHEMPSIKGNSQIVALVSPILGTRIMTLIVPRKKPKPNTIPAYVAAFLNKLSPL
ncbi:hypothetical protein AB3N58_14120 [Leptospira sp. WS60.C2]